MPTDNELANIRARLDMHTADLQSHHNRLNTLEMAAGPGNALTTRNPWVALEAMGHKLKRAAAHQGQFCTECGEQFDPQAVLSTTFEATACPVK